jgi:hypothetical protein
MNLTVAFFFLVLNGCPVNSTRFTTTLSGLMDNTLLDRQMIHFIIQTFESKSSNLPVATRERAPLGMRRKTRTGEGGNTMGQ